MKKDLLQPALIFLFLAVFAATIYVTPILFDALETVSYKFVLLFLLFIFASNMLAKIAHKYITL